MLEQTTDFEVCQMPINCFDPSYKSFILNVLPTLVERNMGVIAMKTLANHGADGFYTGKIAANIATAVQSDLNIGGDMTEEDRLLILKSVNDAIPNSDAVVVLHGTDTLAKTGELLHRELGEIDVPVILTGAMKPYEFRDTDGLQNVTEALVAAKLLSGGVYAVMHNRVLPFPGVTKDRQARTLIPG